jgi:hypothetical protein
MYLSYNKRCAAVKGLTTKDAKRMKVFTSIKKRKTLDNPIRALRFHFICGSDAGLFFNNVDFCKINTRSRKNHF